MTPQILHAMVEKGYAINESKAFQLTELGEKRSRLIIRRHRLAERLLHEILDVRNNEEMDAQACLMEHILTERVTERICKFLGHPTRCPHSKIIPSGECCTVSETHLTPYIRRLCDFNVGESGVVSFIASENHERVSHLAAWGLYPNAVVKLSQKKPATIVEINATTLSIDSDISKEIFLRV
jgi:DtxR family Mn-dependent transcriptional regulator